MSQSSQEPVQTEFSPLQRWAPLPWLLLVFVVGVWLLTFFMARSRVLDEQARWADAVKAADQQRQAMTQVQADMKQAEAAVADMAAQKASLEQDVDKLKRALADKREEIQALKAAAAAGPKPSRPVRR